MPHQHDPYIVSDATCKGCIYYRYLSGGFTRACHYTYDTGKFRPLDMKCADCTYKTTRKRRVNEHSSRGGKRKRRVRKDDAK